MTLKIENPEVAELFFAARQLLLNSSYSAFLKPSLDRVRAALARFNENDALANAMPTLTPEALLSAAAPVVEPVEVPPVKPARKKAAKTAEARPAKKTVKAKPVKKTAKKAAKKKAK